MENPVEFADWTVYVKVSSAREMVGGGGILIHPAREDDRKICESKAEVWRCHRHVSLLQTAQKPTSKGQEEDVMSVDVIDVPTSVREDDIEECDSGEAGTGGEGHLTRRQSLRTRHPESEGLFPEERRD